MELMKSSVPCRFVSVALRRCTGRAALGLLFSLELISCDGSADDPARAKPGQASTQESRARSAREPTYGKETVLKTLRQKGSSKTGYAYLASDIRQMLKAGNRSDFDELVATLTELGAWDHNFGIEIMRDLDPSLRPLAMEWISNISDPTLRYHTKAGALGQWIALDPVAGLELLSSLDEGEKGEADPSIVGEVKPVTSFEHKVWSGVGRAAGDPAMTPATKDRILEAVAGLSPEMLKAYCGGLAGGLGRLIGKEIPVNYGEMTEGLDSKGVGMLVADLASDSTGIYKHPASVRELLGFMESMDGDLKDLYWKIGSTYDFDSFSGELLEQGNLSGKAREALVKAWSHRRPEDAATLVAEKYPELLPPIFEGWIETNPTDAEAWIRGSQSGSTKTAAVKKRCELLIMQGRADELANWIDLLPQADRASYQDALRLR